MLLEKGKAVNRENIEKARRDVIAMAKYMESDKDGCGCLWFNPLPHLEILEDEDERYVPFEQYLKKHKGAK